jgi:hypothetical protein
VQVASKPFISSLRTFRPRTSTVPLWAIAHGCVMLEGFGYRNATTGTDRVYLDRPEGVMQKRVVGVLRLQHAQGPRCKRLNCTQLRKVLPTEPSAAHASWTFAQTAGFNQGKFRGR